MVDETTQQAFPNIPVPFVDESRVITPSWRYLLQALWMRTGGAFAQVVQGAATSVNNNLPLWDGTNGNMLKDSGYGIGTSGHNVVAADGANTFSAAQTFVDGSVASPSVAVGDAGGFYKKAAGEIAVAILGVLRFYWTATGAVLSGLFVADEIEATTTVTAGTDLIAVDDADVGGVLRARAGGTIVAGGRAVALFESDTIGIYVGSGSPNTVLNAPQGSLYLRSDGTTTNDRAYINVDGATAWTAIVTVA